MRRAQDHNGFTLVELIAAMIVLAVIAGIAIPRFVDAGGRARASAEAAVIGAVRTAIRAKMLNNAVIGNPGAPGSLDAVAAGGFGTLASPLFAAVLDSPVTSNWRKGSSINQYIAPSGTTYTYDPSTGQFDTQIAVVAGTGPGTTGSSSAMELTTASTWTAGGSQQLGAGRLVGAGYSLVNGEIMLDSAGGFTEDARRVLISGQTIAAGTFTLALDTALTNYWNQLNYWQVYAVRNGTTLSLSGNTLNWGTAPAGTKLLAQNYAPDSRSNGNWFSYQDTFNVSAADAAGYDQVVVVMAGTRSNGQMLGWRNVNLFQP